MGEVSGAWRNIPGSGFEVRATDCEFGDSLLIRCYSLFFCATADAAFALSVCRQVVCSDLSVARNESRKNSLLNSLINSLFLKQQRNLSLLQHEKSIHGLAAPRDLLVSALLVNLNS